MSNEPPPWPVYPTAASPSIGVFASAPIIYEIVPIAEALPVIDNTKTIKGLLLGAAMRLRVNRVYRRHRRAMLISFFVGLMAIAIGALARVEIARPTAVASCIAMLPAQLSYVLEMRYQFIKLLFQSFEFWYTSTLIMLWTISGATMFNDARVCSLLMPCLGMELQLLGDACTRPMRSLVISALVSVALSALFMGFAAFGMIEQTKVLRVTASQDGRLVVSNRDIFINTALPLMILGTRLGYNKYQALKHRHSHSDEKEAAAPTPAGLETIFPPGRVAVTPGVRCMAYRCRLKMQRYTGTARGHSRHSLDSVPARSPASSLLPLRAVRIRELFHAEQIVFPRVSPSGDLATPQRLLYQLTGLTGLIASATAFHSHVSDAPDLARVTIALGCTSAYCGYFFCVSHRRLLRRLFRSFDFTFVLVQMTLELVVLAHMYTWQATASLGGALPCWMWFWHVMTLDAITPEIRQRLGFRVRYLAPPVLLYFMIGHVWLAIELLVYNQLDFEDSILVNLKLGTKMFKMKAASFALTRALTSFVWSARLLWRICSNPDASNDSLVMLHGYVEFDYVRRDGLGSVRVAPTPRL